jgi:nitrite reductase/ring-hydroxylating ferredoxin subunit
MKHELCKTADVPDDGSIVVSFFGRELHVYRTNNDVRAAANVCLHLGGPLECRDGKFVSPWHGAAYDMATRARLSGPSRREAKLMFLPTRVEGDALYVWGEPQ